MTGSPQSPAPSPERALVRITLLSISALYLLLLVPNLGRLGIGWDEAFDLEIARAYLSLRGLFFGLPLDLSQTRLPTFSVALVFRLLGDSSLLVARWTSVAVGGITLLGTYVYGKGRFGAKTGILAAGLLALNPFFLSFARLAFTESDVYLACTLIWLLVAVSRLQQSPTVGRAAVAGVLLGLTFSAKATALVIFPAVWYALLSSPVGDPGARAEAGNVARPATARLLLFWAGWTAALLLMGLYISWRLETSAASGEVRLLHYGLVGLGWLVPLGWAYRQRRQTAGRWPLIAFVTGLGLLTFAVFPPDHLTNTGIICSLFSRTQTEVSLDLGLIGELAALHLLVLFLKPTPVLGIGLIIGAVMSLSQWQQREVRLPLTIAATYFAALLLLPLGQTFYTIPIVPLLSLLAAHQFMRLWSHRRRAALALAFMAVGWWGAEMIQCYPDYHLNGYQWLGRRVLFGRSSIGYRSVVFTPADGVQQAVEWLKVNARPGQVAQLYVSTWHIVRAVAPQPEYQLTNGYETTLESSPDYVVVHINDLLWEGHGADTPVGDVMRYPFDLDVLMRDYEQVFVVQRAFNLEVASVWRRK